MSEVLIAGGAAAVATFVVFWPISLALRNASIVDPVWGPSFAVVAWVAYAVADEPGGRGLVLCFLVSIWALRLGLYLTVRAWGKPEDFRYAAMRRRWGSRFPLVSLATVFLLQAVLMWIVSLPVQVGISNGGEVGWLASIGAVVFLIGFAFETFGDLQLARFKADPANAGKVMDGGLWRYTRHPNYFGDFTVWWGLFLVAVTGWDMVWTVVGPVLMSFLLLRVSGVAMLERAMPKRRAGYEDYVARTNAFFPWRPRPNPPGGANAT